MQFIVSTQYVQQFFGLNAEVRVSNQKTLFTLVADSLSHAQEWVKENLVGGSYSFVAPTGEVVIPLDNLDDYQSEEQYILTRAGV